MLQERVAQEQRQQTAAPTRGYSAITTELSTERQARQMAERRIAELEAQMATLRTPAQRLEGQQRFRGPQEAPMLPRPLQIGARMQRPVLGRQPQMAAVQMEGQDLQEMAHRWVKRTRAQESLMKRRWTWTSKLGPTQKFGSERDRTRP